MSARIIDINEKNIKEYSFCAIYEGKIMPYKTPQKENIKKWRNLKEYPKIQRI